MNKLGKRIRAFGSILTLLFTTIPFALLVNSSEVRMALHIEKDGSARRLISASVSPYFRQQVAKWTNDVQAGARWERTFKSDSADSATYTYARDFRIHNVNKGAEHGELKIEDVWQNPLSLYTIYTWREDIAFSYLYATDPQIAKAGGSQLIYEIIMPGRVLEATVTENKVKREDNKPSGQSSLAPPASAPAEAGPRAPAETPGAIPALPPAETPASPPVAAPEAANTPPAPENPAGSASAPPNAATPAQSPSAPGGTAPAQPPAPTPAPGAPLSPSPAGAISPSTPEAAPSNEAQPEASQPAQAFAPPSSPNEIAALPAATRGQSSYEIEGNKAIFKLDASKPSWTITVTARRVRWGYLAILVYLAAFIVFKLVEGLQRAARLRPRKI